MSGKRKALAWSPSLVVLLCGLAAWLGAFTGKDGFAHRMLSVTIVAALVAATPAWAATRRWLGFAAAVAVKVAAFFALAPHGSRSLSLSWEQVRDGGAWDDYLVYFWALPPLLLCVTLAESWLLGVWLSGRTPRQTKLWARRRPLGIATALAVVLGAGWRFGRVDYYLWRIRAGDAPARYSLERVGPRALPAIYREIHRLGSSDAGAYRSDLVSVIRDIRHDVVARRIDSVLVWDVEAALVDVDPRMLEALETAFVQEPEREQLKNMAIWAGELDFNTQVDLFCGVFERVPTEGQAELVLMLDSSVRRSAGQVDPPAGQRQSSQRDAETQARMRSKLACVPPLLIGALERDADQWSETVPLWGTDSMRMLGGLTPLPGDGGKRLLGLVPRFRNGYLTNIALENLWSELTRAAGKPAEAMLADLYRAQKAAEARTGLRLWLREKAPGPTVRRDVFFCRTLTATPEDERPSHFWLVESLSNPDPCVASTLMQSFEKVLLGEQPAPFIYGADDWLAKRKGSDARVSSWARELQPRLHKRVRYRLDALL